MASDDLQRLVELVTGETVDDIDLNLVGLLAVDPEAALEQFPGLTGDERAAIVERDAEALQRVGLTEGAASGVLSGAHTPRCPK